MRFCGVRIDMVVRTRSVRVTNGVNPKLVYFSALGSYLQCSPVLLFFCSSVLLFLRVVIIVDSSCVLYIVVVTLLSQTLNANHTVRGANV